MSFEIEPASPEAVLHVLQRMREADRREALAVMPREADLWTLLVHYQNLAPYHLSFMSLEVQGAPVAILGVWRMREGIGEAHLLGTPDFDPLARMVAKSIRSSAPDFMKRYDLRRISCACMADHRRARAFLKLAGAAEEARLKAFGRDGEDFVQFVWLR